MVTKLETQSVGQKDNSTMREGMILTKLETKTVGQKGNLTMKEG